MPDVWSRCAVPIICVDTTLDETGAYAFLLRRKTGVFEPSLVQKSFLLSRGDLG